jgi:hypothetical protein
VDRGVAPLGAGAAGRDERLALTEPADVDPLAVDPRAAKSATASARAVVHLCWLARRSARGHQSRPGKLVRQLAGDLVEAMSGRIDGVVAAKGIRTERTEPAATKGYR